MPIRFVGKPVSVAGPWRAVSFGVLGSVLLGAALIAQAEGAGWYANVEIGYGPAFEYPEVCAPSETGHGTYADTYAGACQTGDVSERTVHILEDVPEVKSHHDFYMNVVGGGSLDARATKNTVVIADVADSQIGIVHGGMAFQGGGAAADNTVKITDSQIRWGVYGGEAVTGDVTGNKVAIKNSLVNSTVFGGSTWNWEHVRKYGDGEGHIHDNSDYNPDNTVHHEASGNVVVIAGSTVGYGVIGGETNFGAAKDNKVTLTDSTVRVVTGGVARDGDALNNTVVVSGGKVLAHKPDAADWGGDADYLEDSVSAGVVGGLAETGSARGNTVVIDGDAEMHQAIVAGFSGNQDATDNRVILRGHPDLKAATLYGGYAPAGQSRGNVLEIHGTGFQAQNVYGFQAYHFLLPANTQNGDVILTLAPDAAQSALTEFVSYDFETYKSNKITQDTDLRDAKVGVALQSGAGQVLQKGDRVALIRNANGVKTAGIEQTQLTGYQGIALQYDFTLENDNGENLDKDKNNTTLWAVLADDTEDTAEEKPAEKPQEKPEDTEQSEKADEPDGADDDPDAAPIVDGSQSQQPESPVVQVQDQSKAPVEGRLGMLALLQQGATLVNQGIDQALYAAQSGETRLFLAVDGNHSRYDTGSHMRLNGVNFMLGLTQQLVYEASAATLGAFIEAGEGSYTTYNTFDTGRVRGSGNSHYYGGGVLGRYDWLQGELAGLYAQGALHVGHTRGDWHSGDMFNSDGNVRYQTAGTYYAAHAGVGYKLDLNADWSLDLYDKYYLTYVGGDSATLSGDRFHFKAMHSSLNQLGARMSSDLTKNWTGYVGAAWEREFNGTARASVYGLSTASPSLKGDSGMFEVGIKTREASTSPIHLGVALEGHTGVHRGLGLNVQASYRF